MTFEMSQSSGTIPVLEKKSIAPAGDRNSKGPVVAMQKSSHRKSGSISSGNGTSAGSPRTTEGSPRASASSPRLERSISAASSPRASVRVSGTSPRSGTSPTLPRGIALMQEGNPLMVASPRVEEDLLARGSVLTVDVAGHKKSKSVAVGSGSGGGGGGGASSAPPSAQSSSPVSSASPDGFVAPQKIAPQPVTQPPVNRSGGLTTSTSNPLLASGGLTRQDSRDLLPGSRNQIMNLLGREVGSGRLSRKGSLAQPMDEATKARMDGDALMKRKRPVEAFEFYNRAIALEPENPGHFVSRAVAHLKVDSFMLAVVDCETALGFDPLNGAAYARKAKALLAMGRNEEAAECFEKARAIDPKLKELKKMNLTDMRNLRQTLKNKQSNSNLRATASTSAPPGFMSPRPTQGLFGVSLEELMVVQKATHPDLVVPEVLTMLSVSKTWPARSN